jgi:phosphoglycolate phosphatase-like HAD superfamily hydrolase
VRIGTTPLFLLAALGLGGISGQEDPLPSWNDGAAKRAIFQFVRKAQAVPEAERIAVFDNDGTLWAEQPAYVQLAFIVDRVKTLAPAHPEWKETDPFKSILAGDVKKALASGEKGLAELVAATHGGMSSDEFNRIVLDWIKTARHPKLDRPYPDLIFQPMLEVLAFLRANGFKTYIVSGGGADFMRPWTHRVYGIPPEQVIGSTSTVKYELKEGVPTIVRTGQIDFVDDKEGKPVAIHRHIGRRPVAAFGNSDGDLQMLQWTTAGEGPRFGLIVRHTDAEREWAYDRESHIGKLDKALDEAAAKGWTVVDMKKDWKKVFAFQK